MNKKDPKLIVLQFNDCINGQNIEKLSSLMAQDYKFVDSSNDVYEGKEQNVNGWMEFFNQFPDYRNHFSILESKSDEVLVIGHSTCSDERLDGPAIWAAKVENDLIAEWRVYLDTPEVRGSLDLSIKEVSVT
jgi:ketosteroid isomerase-like protein